MTTPAATKKEATTYIVLEREGEELTSSYRDVAKVQATNSTAAIKEAIAGDPDASGTYVAVPERSWRPVTVKLETKTTIKLG